MAKHTDHSNIGTDISPVAADFPVSLPSIGFVEYTHWEKGKSVAPHSHEDMFQFDYFPQGQGTYAIDGQQYQIDPSVFFLVYPGHIHEITNSPDNLLENLTAKFGHNNWPDGFFPATIKLSHGPVAELSRLFRRAISAGVLTDPVHRAVASYRLGELLVLLRYAWEQDQGTGSGTKYTALAKAYMSQHLAEPITLHDLSDSVGIAREHLCRAFKEDTGKTPFAYLRELRVINATKLLKSTELDIATIAAQTGFGGAGHMSRIFQKHIGISPSRFRRQQSTKAS